MLFEVVTLFPKVIETLTGYSILQRAKELGLIEIRVHNLRDYGLGKHQQVDDYRFGGGPGMLLRPEPFFQVMEKLLTPSSGKKEMGSFKDGSPTHPLVVVPSAQGKPFQQDDAEELLRENHIIFLCGHYKGIDQRVIDRFAHREFSLGDYVISGGELAAAVMIDAVVRLIPGVLGDLDSALEDSFQKDKLDSVHYTRPQEIRGMRIPPVLLTGHKRNIERWREAVSWFMTRRRRPDLFQRGF